MRGREDEAMEVLEALADKPRSDPYIQNEFGAIKETLKEMSKGSYRSLFVMSEYREFHRVVLAYVIQVFQQISGINLITYYAPQLYAQIGLEGNNLPKLLAAANGTEYFLASFVPIFIIEKVGRRPLMLFGVRIPPSSLTWRPLIVVAHSGRRHVPLHGGSRRHELPRLKYGRHQCRSWTGRLPLRLQHLLRLWLARHDLAVPRRDCAPAYPRPDQRALH